MTDAGSTPPLEYRNPMHREDPRRARSLRTVVGWIAGVSIALVLLVSCLLPTMGRARESANRVKCASNLRQLTNAVFLYANENRGHLPPDWPAVLTTQDVVPEVFTCPSKGMDRATGATTQAVVAALLSGDHLDYVWAGGDLQYRDLTPTTVLAFELKDHLPQGMNVMLGDGSVEFVDEATAKAIRAHFIAGIRPLLRPPTATPATTSAAAR